MLNIDLRTSGIVVESGLIIGLVGILNTLFYIAHTNIGTFESQTTSDPDITPDLKCTLDPTLNNTNSRPDPVN